MSETVIDDPRIEALPRDQNQHPQLDALEILATLMDSAIMIPGTKITFGFDALIGLIPILGDTISLGISTFITSYAKEINLPKHKIWLMRFNIFIDWLIGCVPFIGDLFDLGWKANRKNIKIMRDHIAQQDIIL